MSGLGQLDYAPSPTTLRALLAHLAAPTGGEAAAAPAAPNAQEEVEEGGRGPGQRRSLVLEAFSCQMLTDIVRRGVHGFACFLGGKECRGLPWQFHELAHPTDALLSPNASLRLLSLSLPPSPAPPPPQVCALRRIIQPRRYPESQLPPAVLSAFFDSFDTVLGGRAGMAPKLGASPKLRAEPLRAELELTPQHVGGVCWALAGIPGASLS